MSKLIEQHKENVLFTRKAMSNGILQFRRKGLYAKTISIPMNLMEDFMSAFDEDYEEGLEINPLRKQIFSLGESKVWALDLKLSDDESFTMTDGTQTYDCRNRAWLEDDQA